MMAHLLRCYPKKFSGNTLRPSIWLYLLYSFVCPVIQRVVAVVNSPTTTMMTTTAATTTTPHHQRWRGRGRLSASHRSTATTTTRGTTTTATAAYSHLMVMPIICSQTTMTSMMSTCGHCPWNIENDIYYLPHIEVHRQQ